MNFQEIAENAYRRKGTDKYADLPTDFAYYQLQDLYNRYQIGKISKEDSILEKKKIEKQYNDNKKEYEQTLNVYKEYNKNRIKCELLLAKIEKAENKDEALRYALEVIGICLSDNSFLSRNLQKLNLN